MAFISAFTLIRAISLFHLTAAYYFLTAPHKLAEQSMVFLIGQAMQIPQSKSFETQSESTALLSLVLAFLALSDLVALPFFASTPSSSSSSSSSSSASKPSASSSASKPSASSSASKPSASSSSSSASTRTAEITATLPKRAQTLEYWSTLVPIRLVLLFALTSWIYITSPGSLDPYRDSASADARRSNWTTAKDHLRTDLVFAIAFGEVCVWFWAFVLLREERRSVAVEIAAVAADAAGLDEHAMPR